MITVYQANSSFDAKLAQDLLLFEGIESHIMGDFLQGGVGELQPQSLVKVMADENDFDRAKHIIQQWQEKEVSKTQQKLIGRNGPSEKNTFFKPLLGFIIFIFIVGSYFLSLN